MGFMPHNLTQSTSILQCNAAMQLKLFEKVKIKWLFSSSFYIRSFVKLMKWRNSINRMNWQSKNERNWNKQYGIIWESRSSLMWSYMNMYVRCQKGDRLFLVVLLSMPWNYDIEMKEYLAARNWISLTHNALDCNVSQFCWMKILFIVMKYISFHLSCQLSSPRSRRR